jgi:uncharacterized protein involved in exopolysaccharide biosynthesis
MRIQPESPQQFPYSTEIVPDSEGRTHRRASTIEEHDDGALELPWYVRALQRRWLFAVVGAVLGGALLFGLASRQRLLYQGVTTLLVMPPSQPGGATMNPATFRAIVENATLASQIIDELKLAGPPHQLTPQTFVEDALNVEEVRGTNVVKVNVTLADPQAAAEASRRLAARAIVLARQISDQEAASLQEQLGKHVNDARGRLQQAERDLLAYQQKAQVDLIKQDTRALLEERGGLLRLTVDIEAERARLAAAELEIKRQQPLLTVPRMPGADEALRRVQQEPRAAATPPGTPQAASRDAAQGRPPALPKDDAAAVEQLDLTNPFVNPVYQTLDFQIATSRTRIAALEKERDELINRRQLGGNQLKQLGELYSREIELARHEAGLDLARRVYGDLALRYEQSRTLNTGSTAQLQVVDQAQPPTRPLSRKRVQKAAFGSAAGFVGAVLLILLWEGLREGRGRHPQGRAT